MTASTSGFPPRTSGATWPVGQASQPGLWVAHRHAAPGTSRHAQAARSCAVRQGAAAASPQARPAPTGAAPRQLSCGRTYTPPACQGDVSVDGESQSNTHARFSVPSTSESEGLASVHAEPARSFRCRPWASEQLVQQQSRGEVAPKHGIDRCWQCTRPWADTRGLSTGWCSS